MITERGIKEERVEKNFELEKLKGTDIDQNDPEKDSFKPNITGKATGMVGILDREGEGTRIKKGRKCTRTSGLTIEAVN